MARANLLPEEDFFTLQDEEDEALSKWKKAIKEEVEEDIQRQVNLRLKSNVREKKMYSTTISQFPKLQRQHNTKPSTLQRRSNQQAVSVSHSVTEPHQLQAIATSSKENNATSSKENNVEKVANRKNEQLLLDQASESHPTKMHDIPIVCQISEVEDRGSQLSGIFEYVHIKYGTSRNQLKSLLDYGSYETKAVDTSGVGSGPIIKCPIESNISLPTPNLDPVTSDLEVTYMNRRESEAPNFTKPSGNETGTACLNATISFESLVFANRQEMAVTLMSNGLEFESRFESGNLSKAFQVSPREYILVLSPDLYSKRHVQWFYFRMRRMVSHEPYTFKIVNFVKPTSLYNEGMQPLLYSEKRAEQEGNGWTRVGYNISYTSTKAENTLPEMTGNCYTLTWTMVFPFSEDTCYMAHCFPYPYSKMLSHLSVILQNPQKSQYITKTNLSITLAGNAVPLLTITDSVKESSGEKPGIVVSARVHPGETNSSWIMQGLIDYLTSDCDYAKTLRSKYTFQLVPMLNPDGVIIGNYRTSLSGVDLNRVYKSPQANLFPTVNAVKNLIEQCIKERELVLYIDLHGHSRKHNVFMYGCHLPHADHHQLLEERIIPFLLSQHAPEMFDFSSCKFNVQKCKEATGRVVTWRMGVSNSYTMESTFGGSTLTDMKRHFTQEDLMNMGNTLAEVIYHYHTYSLNEKVKHKVQSSLAEVLMSRFKSSRIEDSQPPKAHTTSRSKKKKCGRQILSKFREIDVTILGQESSTSGSDSDNDNFSWKSRKTRKKTRQNNPTKVPLELSQLVKVMKKSSQAKGMRQLLSNEARSGMTGTTGEHTLINRRRATDTSNTPLTLPPGWKFVSKYQNRSNGGIPIFSEERLKERREKQKQAESQSPTPTSKVPQQRRKTWPRYLDPILDTGCTTANCQEMHTRSPLGHLKISSQLAKYISETWKSNQ